MQELPDAPWRDKVQAYSVESALTLVGFWLRAKGIYAFQATSSVMAVTSRQEFYAVFAHDLVPSLSRWTRACSLARSPELHDLAVSFSGRVITALKTRDRAHTAGFFMTDAAARDESLECVDTVALHLMAAFDIAARVANGLLEVSDQRNRAGWQHAKWVKGLPSARLRSAATAHRGVVTIISELRNTIHHKAIRSGVISPARRDNPDWYVVLPAESAGKLQNAMRATGGLDDWGYRETTPGQLWVRPFVLIEQMLVKATEALDELLDAMAEANVQAPSEPATDSWAWEESSRRNIGWQVGGTLERRAKDVWERQGADRRRQE